MTKEQKIRYKNNLLNAISFSRNVKTAFALTTAEIICVHQHANLGKPLAKHITLKLQKIENFIAQANWQRPITRITPEYQNQELNLTTGQWETIK